MREADLGVEYRYDATFASAEPDQSYQIGLARSADIGAPDSYVTLPDPFTPSAPTTSSRSAPLTITWTPGDSDQISINVTGCASAQLGPLPDTGTATFPAGTIVADPSNPPNNPTCDLAFAVSRTRNGTLDRAYGQGGSVVAIQRRTIMISSAP